MTVRVTILLIACMAMKAHSQNIVGLFDRLERATDGYVSWAGHQQAAYAKNSWKECAKNLVIMTYQLPDQFSVSIDDYFIGLGEIDFSIEYIYTGKIINYEGYMEMEFLEGSYQYIYSKKPNSQKVKIQKISDDGYTCFIPAWKNYDYRQTAVFDESGEQLSYDFFTSFGLAVEVENRFIINN